MISKFSIVILLVALIATSIRAETQPSSEPIVHEGQCPSTNFPFPIMCRRRVCLPEELIPLCSSDGNCPTTHKCCRTMCSCRDRCVESVPK